MMKVREGKYCVEISEDELLAIQYSIYKAIINLSRQTADWLEEGLFFKKNKHESLVEGLDGIRKLYEIAGVSLKVMSVWKERNEAPRT